MRLHKGSTGHRTGGTIFVVGMICMTVSAIPLGLLKAQTLNALVGALTCYLVASGWVAGYRNRIPDARIVTAALGLVALAVGALLVKFGIDALGADFHGFLAVARTCKQAWWERLYQRLCPLKVPRDRHYSPRAHTLSCYSVMLNTNHSYL